MKVLHENVCGNAALEDVLDHLCVLASQSLKIDEQMRFSVSILLIIPVVVGVLLAGERMLIPLFGAIIAVCLLVSLINLASDYRDSL